MYLAVLGRQGEISVAELRALFSDVKKIQSHLAVFNSDEQPDINKLGGSLKLAQKLNTKPLDFLADLPDGKITFGVSDYSVRASRKSASVEALKLKKILVRHGRSVRVVENRDATLSTATSLHNGLSGKNERKVELIKLDDEWYRVIGIQDIDAYAKRDQARPARDAKVGMLPPKLAQILINLCGSLAAGARVLDPFCGTGVVLQEALLMGYRVYGTDVDSRMVNYSERNIKWLLGQKLLEGEKDGWVLCSQGDATNFQWQVPIDGVACEGYLGKPFSEIPSEMELKVQKQECQAIIVGFLKNLSKQIKSGTPVVIAAPAWLRGSGTYERLGIFEQLFLKEKVDEIGKLGYNVGNESREGLLYYRENQVVARDIIILRKK